MSHSPLIIFVIFFELHQALFLNVVPLAFYETSKLQKARAKFFHLFYSGYQSAFPMTTTQGHICHFLPNP
jgi:hypothetical protein